MTSIISNESRFEDTASVHKLVVQVCKTAASLQVTDKFLSAVERRILKRSGSGFDIEPIKAALRELKSYRDDVSHDRLLEIESVLQDELDLWFNILDARNYEIETFHFRRFCDSYDQPIEDSVFDALARFYYSLTHTPSNQSKFDLFITRLFTKENSKGFRELSVAQDKLPTMLDSLFKEYGNEKPGKDVKEHTARFCAFVEEAESFEGFEDFVESKLLDRLRAFKFDLAEDFYNPNLVASSIACNAAVGNLFHTLLSKANELATEFSSNFDLAGAFLDTSTNSHYHISDALREMKAESDERETEEMTQLWELLESLCANNEGTSASVTDENSSMAASPLKEAFPETYNCLGPLLVTLTDSEPDTGLLREYMQRSKSLSILDLNDFIGEYEEGMQECREVLSLILLSEGICRNELSQQQTDISGRVIKEVKNILRGTHELLDKLEEITETANETSRKRLLIVSNKLLETGLRLKRTIVKLSILQEDKAEVFRNENEAVNSAEKQLAEKNRAAKIFRLQKKPANRWLIAATLLVGIFGGIFYFFEAQNTAAGNKAQGVEEIQTAELPNGNRLKSAYRQRSTLFITAKDSWKNLPTDTQSKHLKNLLDFPAQQKLELVVIANGGGEMLGDITKDGVRILGELQDSEPESKN